MASVIALNNVGVSGWRFASGTQTNDDGHYQIDNSGHITLTAARRAPGYQQRLKPRPTASC